ncbi:hypothetical protein EDB86DRAFT_2960486 [Lactarius hatsudake]|nr:hypothetical protein EDB86DRAFT_2960486 [Lactarius hatsudake]
MAFAQLEDTLALRPLAVVRPSWNIRSDKNLGWDEVMYAKNTMPHFMAQSGAWPPDHVDSLAGFFIALELHPRRVQDNGNTVLILYQSRVRHEWFDAFKRNQGFDIEVINESFLQTLAEMVNNRIQDRKIEQILSQCCVAGPSDRDDLHARRYILIRTHEGRLWDGGNC